MTIPHVRFEPDVSHIQTAVDNLKSTHPDLVELLDKAGYKPHTNLQTTLSDPVYYKHFPVITYYVVIHDDADKGWMVMLHATTKHPSNTSSFIGRYYPHKVFENEKFEEVALKSLLLMQDSQ